VDRELRAVDSENKKNLQSDAWRMIQLNKSLSSPAHPYHHFSTGNFETLKVEPEKRGLDVRSEFIRFYETHYSANRMKLVILGQDSLDDMEQWVSSLFSDVKNKELPPNRWDGVQPYSGDDMGVQVSVKPVMDSRSIDICFPFMDEEHLDASQPSRYVSHLIGHEGPGSILAYIKAKGWANGLSAGAMPVCAGTAFFTISIRLTQEGLLKHHEIVKVIFQYIAMIKEGEPQQWIFDEMKAMAEVDFRFQQKSPASRFASRLSSIMQRPLPREHLLSNSVIRDFEPELIKKALACLRADNFRTMLVSQEHPGDWDCTEKWYGTPYKVEKLPQDFMAELHEAATSTRDTRPASLHLPHRNEFVPTRLSVERKEVPEPSQAPKIIRHDDRARVWFKKDDRFWVPKATIHATLRNPLVWATPANYVKTKVFCDLVKDALVEYSYDAEIAGLDYNLYAGMQGLEIGVMGYNDKMSVLLEKVMVSMRDLVVNPDRFHISKDRLIRLYRNSEYQHPYSQIMEYTRHLTVDKTWISEQILAELEHIEPEDISAFIPQFLQQNYIELLAHGNLYKEDVLRMTDCIEKTLQRRPLPKSQWLVRRNLVLPPGSNYVYERALKDPANVNHCIEYYLLIGMVPDDDLRAKVLLFSQMTDEPAFDQLRTKEQLGYVVWSGTRYSATTMGYRVIIQSDRNAKYLESRIDSFLTNYGQVLENMGDAQFEAYKKSIINRRLEKVKNLMTETGRFWLHISSEYYDFLQHETDAAAIRNLTKADMVEFFKRYIDPLSPSRAKLSIYLNAQGGAHVNGAGSEDEGKDCNGSVQSGVKQTREPTYVTSVADFKANTALTAGPNPVADLSEYEDFEAKL
jgi:insulysin